MFALTEVEVACGITVEQVHEAARKALVGMNDGRRIAVMPNVGPALAGAAARARFQAPVEFLGMNPIGLPVYGVEGETR